MINKTGIEYGVMFPDGSVRKGWNGRTERQRATEEAELLARRHWPDRITLARRLPGGDWERIPS